MANDKSDKTEKFKRDFIYDLEEDLKEQSKNTTKLAAMRVEAR